MTKLSALLLATTMALAGQAAQAEDEACATVKLADPGWTDIAVTNGVASFLLDSLGYQAKVDTLSVPITYGGLRDGQVDAFLGNWMPAQQGFHDQFIASGQVTRLAKNLEGTEFTLAVPTYVYNAGVKNFADLQKHADQFNHKVYGIGSGAPANQSIQKMIGGNEFGLGDWKLVESSEQAMLAEVGRAVKRERWIVFLGWTPHPMNVKYDMKYLAGGDKYFGSTGSVYTVTRNGYAQQCPNSAKLLANLSFDLKMENAIMAEVLEKNVKNADAVKAWIKANPQVLGKWLDGVKARDGGDALAAVQAKL
ncbi:MULTISPECIES: choline ABC transporter substrate-binding protein [Pseudomonas]|jgi:glycine betaine/proline transport system substrate-binding protein|uniref:choline ABC transporter substrate-binding protein n=1 Tax=Pseudomonas TaxID=286 RepID=UPI0005BB4F81|nr:MULTISPECIES: choline ABC transporter substrate-binding protein [Pseudomonas]KRV63943.1 glycine/betaine ABC transporter substrate-binding protein [Pseudomonas citronellolis]KRW78821.1 glycine/betaine ABC transporter substrate-binding protein [Pseudomonas citronellolis]KWR83691.1 glycine/betaine ABC transporter substrate-binding protein [Pseudomonas sp. PI1]WAB94025.1 choline ABC transporter substrate-binding protein [Pseudomonas citronellolis]